jgi:hypothetical protein
VISKNHRAMNPQTGYRVLKGLAVLFALNGIPGVLVSMVALCLFLIEFLTGFAVLPHRGQQHPTVGGTLVVLGMASFWVVEVTAAWLVWRRPSRLVIYLAVSVIGLWAVCAAGIALEVAGDSTPASQLRVLLCTAAIVCWPCVALARWLCSGLLSGPVVPRMAGHGDLSHGGPAEGSENSGAGGGQPSVR